MSQRCVNFLNGRRLGKGGSVALTGAVKSAICPAVEDKVDAAAMCFLADHIPFFHHKGKVGREREHAIAEHRIVLREPEDRRLQVCSKCNSLKMLPRLVEGAQECGGDFCQGRIIFHDQ